MNTKGLNKNEIIGERIRNRRIELGLTQAQLADSFKEHVSYQSVSLWEKGNLPTIDNMIELAEILGVSVSSLVETRDESLNSTTMALFDYNHMFTFLKGALKGMPNSLKALNNIKQYHEGQYRKTNRPLKSDEELVPYIYHPLSLACNLMALDLKDDELVAAAILHDVLEDCVMVNENEEIRSKIWVEKYNKEHKNKYTYRELEPEDLSIVDKNVQHLVSILTCPCSKDDQKGITKYYNAIAKEPKAALIKCADRFNNLSSMAWGLSRNRMYKQIIETETYYPKLLKVIKDTPKYNNAAWLYVYQVGTLLDVFKRLL